MANSISTGKIYIDSTGEIATSQIKIAHILFTPDAANDQIILRETSSGSDVLKLRGATAKETLHYDFSNKPIVFENGLYVQTLSTGAVATVITTKAGS